MINRRDFFGLTGAAAAALAIDRKADAQPHDGMPNTEAKFASAGNLSGDTPSAGSLSLSISSEFMEDYAKGAPFIRFTTLQQTYVARSGSEQFFTIVPPGWGEPSVDRVYPDPDSDTGYSIQHLVLPDDIPRGRAAIFPQAVLAQTSDGDKLIICRAYSTQIASVDQDGTTGPLKTLPKGEASVPLVTGQLPTNSFYYPEVTYPARLGGFTMAGIQMRKVQGDGNETYGVDPSAFPTSYGDQRARQLFPLKATSANFYRCITVEETGDVAAVTLAFDGGSFNVTEHKILAHSPSGCVYVSEPVAGHVEVVLVEVPAIQTIAGAYNVNDASPCSWHAAVTANLPDFKLPNYPSGTTYSLGGAWNEEAKAIELFLKIRGPEQMEPKTEIWTTLRDPHGNWLELGFLDAGCRTVDTFASGPGLLCISRQRTGFEIWRRDAEGEWDIDHIRLQDENSPMVDAASYRVGIGLSAEGVAAGGEVLGLTCSSPVSAFVGGEHVALRTHKPQKIVTDSTGTAWVTLFMEERISFPTLCITSPRWKDCVAIDLNEKTENFFKNITPDKLRSAHDPRTGQKILKDPMLADKISSTLRDVMSFTPEHAALDVPAGPHPAFRSNVPLRWISPGTSLASLRRPVVPQDGPHWHLEKNRETGELTYTVLTAHEAHLRLTSLRAVHNTNAAMFDIFSDFADWVSDTATAVWDGVCEVASVLKTAAGVAVQLVIDGVTFAYEAVLDTVERVLDAITFVLDMAGELLGAAVGWLLEQLGFLFDWKEIKRKRDELRATMQAGANMLQQKLPDPKIAFASAGQAIESAKREVKTQLTKLRSTPLDKATYAQLSSKAPNLDALYSIGNISLMPQATWLFDKVQSYFPKLGGDAFDSANIPGLDGFATTLMTKFAVMGATLIPTLGDVQTLVDGWIANAKLFSEAALDPIIDILIRHVDGFFDAVKSLLQAVGDFLHALWANPDAVLEWMGRKISIPFFGGFYRGLTGNDFSMLDFACLAAAVPAVAASQQEQRAATGKPAHIVLADYTPPNGARGAAKGFMIASCITTALSSGFMAQNGNLAQDRGTKLDRAGDVLTGLNLAMELGWTLSSLVVGGVLVSEIVVPTLIGIAGVGLAIGFSRAASISVDARREFTGAAIENGIALTFLYHLIRFGLDTSINEDLSLKLRAVLIFRVFSSLATMVVRRARPLKPAPYAAIGYGALQGGVSGLCAYFYWDSV